MNVRCPARRRSPQPRGSSELQFRAQLPGGAGEPGGINVSPCRRAGWGRKRAWGTLDSPSALGPSQHSPHLPLPPLSAQGAHSSDRAGPVETLRVGFVGASSLLSWGEFGIAGGFSPKVPKFRKSGRRVSGAAPLGNRGQACEGVRSLQPRPPTPLLGKPRAGRKGHCPQATSWAPWPYPHSGLCPCPQRPHV